MSSSESRSRTPVAVWAAGVAVLAMAICSPSVVDRFSAFDDDDFILSNPQIVDPMSQPILDLLLTPHIGYIVPVTNSVEAAIYWLGGGSALLFHLVGLLLHGLVAALTFLTARQALRIKARGDSDVRRWRVSASALAALLFVTHPLVVEPVAWATGLKDLLMAAFGLGATLFFLKGTSTKSEPRARRRFLMAAVLAVMAVLSKPTGAFLAVAWLGWILSWRMRRHHRGVPGDHGPVRLKEAAVPALIALAVGCVLTLLSAFMHSELRVEDPAGLSEGAWQPLLALGHQLSHFFWPADLAPRYRIDRGAGLTDFYVLLGVVGWMAVLAGLYWLRRRPVALLGATLALAAYLPVSSIIPFPRMVADSYLYLPLAGLSIALAPVFCRCLSLPSTRRRLFLGVYGCLVLLLGARAADQAKRWRSPVTLWYPVAQTEELMWPYAWRVMAESLELSGDHDGATLVWEQFFARGEYPPYLGHYGLSLARSGRLDDAECVLLESIYTSGEPTDVHNLALLLAQTPDRVPRYPEHSLKALNWALETRARGELGWGSKDLAALDAVQGQTAAAISSAESVWSGGCSALNVEATEGPPL